MQEKLEADLEKLRGKHSGEIADYEYTHEQALQDLEDKHQVQLKELNTQISSLEKDLKSAQEEVQL